MHEFPPQDQILRKRDANLILVVPAETFGCLFCTQPKSPGTTVDWLGTNVKGPSGRCRECGQKYQLADAFLTKETRAWLLKRIEESNV